MKQKDPASIDVVIETPKACRNKYAWDKKEKKFRLKKILPAGAVFPFDFGFIPKTKGEDGDPLDILVIMDEPAFPGCLVECKLIGALKAEQKERNGLVEENDRLIGICIHSELYKDYYEVEDLNEQVLKEIEHFFISYNEMAGKEFKPKGWTDSKEAFTLIKKAVSK